MRFAAGTPGIGHRQYAGSIRVFSGILERDRLGQLPPLETRIIHCSVPLKRVQSSERMGKFSWGIATLEGVPLKRINFA